MNGQDENASVKGLGERIDLTALLAHVLTLLLGPGLMGGALALMGKEDLQETGLRALYIFLGFAFAIILILLIIYGAEKILAIRERERYENLTNMRDWYEDSMVTSASYLRESATKTILPGLAADLRNRGNRLKNQAPGTRSRRKALNLFLQSIERIASEWEKIGSGESEKSPVDPR